MCFRSHWNFITPQIIEKDKFSSKFMGFNPQTPSPSHLYSQELQLKLYQAFIFSIPILFSIILFLLFYLFYLKKRVSSISSTSANLPQITNPRAAVVSSSAATYVDEIFKEKLPVIQYDEHLKTRETLCCVCLGEFEVKEELHQIPSCKHVFHIDCISHWLHSNTTCPLCRCSVVISTTTKAGSPEAIASGNNLRGPDTETFNQSPRIAYAEQPQQLSVVVSRVEICAAEQLMDPNEGSSGSSGDSVCQNNADESVVISIQS